MKQKAQDHFLDQTKPGLGATFSIAFSTPLHAWLLAYLSDLTSADKQEASCRNSLSTACWECQQARRFYHGPNPSAHLFPRQDVPGQLHLGKVTLANGLKEPVVANMGLLVSRGG